MLEVCLSHGRRQSKTSAEGRKDFAASRASKVERQSRGEARRLPLNGKIEARCRSPSTGPYPLIHGLVARVSVERGVWQGLRLPDGTRRASPQALLQEPEEVDIGDAVGSRPHEDQA